MQHAKKLILISPEKLHHYQTISNLDEEMTNILNNKSISVEEKWVQYKDVLQKYLHLVQKPSTTTTATTTSRTKNREGEEEEEEEEDEDDEIISSLPELCLRKARPLLRKLKQNPYIQWDARGSVHIYNKLIPGSNIVDLISDFVRCRKKNIPPTGWEPFAVLLAKSNIPLEYIGNPQRIEYIRKLVAAPKEEEEGEPSRKRKVPKWCDYKV